MEGFFGEGFPGLNLPPSSTPKNGTLRESPPLPQSPLTQASPPPPPPVPSNSPPPPVVEPPPSPLPSSAVVPPPPDTSKSETPPSPQIFSFLTPPPPPTPSASFPPPDGSSTMSSPLPSSPQVGTPTSKPPSPPSNPENPPSTSNSSSTVLLPLPIPLSPPLPSPAEFPSSPIIQSPITPVINPPVPGDVPNSLPPPGSPEFSSPPVNPLPTPTKPTDSSSSTSQERPSSNTSPSLTPPKLSNPSPSIPSSEGSSDSSSGIGYAAIVGVALAGVVLVLFAVIIVVVRKKRKPDRLAVQYKPPSSYSGKSEGYYYKQANITNSVQFSTQSGPPLFPSATGTFGSQRNQLSYSGGPSGNSAIFGNSKSSFTYEEIADMTQGFSQQNLLGEGGFGCVYKGRLTDGKVVAVKQLKAGSGQGEREFRAEVEIISRIHHRHLVSLVGYCISDHHRSLVYEFVPNNTLEHHLHGKALPVMDWPTRLKISIGSARGLAYLHEDCHPRIIHRDIKSANILLDDSFEAQVADFGLAKLSNDTSTHVSTRVMGTFG